MNCSCFRPSSTSFFFLDWPWSTRTAPWHIRIMTIDLKIASSSLSKVSNVMIWWIVTGLRWPCRHSLSFHMLTLLQAAGESKSNQDVTLLSISAVNGRSQITLPYRYCPDAFRVSTFLLPPFCSFICSRIYITFYPHSCFSLPPFSGLFSFLLMILR